MTVLYVIVGLIVMAFLVVKIFFAVEGKEYVVVEEAGDWELESLDDSGMVIRKPLCFTNVGKQCGVIMDALVRPLLPYEQYDGMAVSGKPELEGAPREDDYFEAVLIQRKGWKPDKLTIYVKVRLEPRKGMSLKEALSHMVDFPVKIIWMQSGRNPWRYLEKRLTVKAADLASLAGVELAED